MKHIVKIFLFSIFYTHCFSQNIVLNGDFEELKRNYIKICGFKLTTADTLYMIDSFTPHWKALFEIPHYHNAALPTDYNGQRQDSLPLPFRGKGCAFILPNYTTYDSINYSPVFNTEPSGKYANFNSFSGSLGKNSGVYQRLRTNLIKDTTYILSFRLKLGSNIRSNSQVFNNIISNFGALLSTKIIADTSQSNIYETKQFLINYYKPSLQDTVFDTSYKWRIIEREFISDSAYSHINLAQFKDLKKANLKIKTPVKYNIGGIFFIVHFSIFIDDIRLLPKWQYLNVTPDVNTCEGDSVELKVVSGAGPYQWAESNNPYTVLSATGAIKVKLADTNIKYQVMSPFDTALIPIYVSKKTYTYDTINYSTCENKPLKVSDPNIFRWYDNTKDTTKTFTATGNYWYETITNCDLKRTQLYIKLDISKYDTIKQTSCDSFTFKNITYKNSGSYTFPYKSILNCDSFQTLNLTINQSKTNNIDYFSCSPYTWLDSTYSKSGSYIRLYKTNTQCDSIITLNLKIGLNDKINLSQGINYTALQDSVFYQWYRCNPWRKITNETKKTFTTSTRGSYSVVLDNGKGCRDTSDCITLYSSGFATTIDAITRIYPNPFNSKLTIELDKFHSEINIKIYDLKGRQILDTHYLNRDKIELDLKEISKGTYYLQIETENSRQFYNIRKD